MKLIDFKVRDDYGTDYYLSFLKTSRYTAIQTSLSLCELPAWPYIRIEFGMGKLFGVFGYFWKFGFEIDLITQTWWI
jgi:hypothetical protein